jgi:FtsH-binding integral membrane protein
VETHFSRTVVLPLLADLVCVLAFAFGGKSSHEASDPTWVVLVIAWPFALAALIGHIGLLGRDRPSTPVWPSGVAVVAITYLLGMTLRAIEGRGIAAGFLIVALVFLSVTMLGWRVATDRLGHVVRR